MVPDATRTSVGITSKSASATSDAEDELDSAAHSEASEDPALASFTSSHQPASSAHKVHVMVYKKNWEQNKQNLKERQ